MSITDRVEELARWGLMTPEELGTDFGRMTALGYIHDQGGYWALSPTGRASLGRGKSNLGWREDLRSLHQRRELQLKIAVYQQRGYSLNRSGNEYALLERGNDKLTLIVNSYSSDLNVLKRLLKSLPGPWVAYHPEPHKLIALKRDGVTVKQL